jgi:hypothetical protein
MKHMLFVIIIVCLLTPSSHAACFQGDCLNGHGAFHSPDGTIYVGDWRDGKYHGHGAFLSPDGTIYVGDWQGGKYHGQGVLTLPDGRQRYGLFKNGTLVQERPTPPSAMIDNGAVLETREKQGIAAPAQQAVPVLPAAVRPPGQYPEASARLLTDADLRPRKAAELRMMVNEIYARHSHIFKSAGLQKHFRRQSWYQAKQQVKWSMLTTVEQTNIKTIRKYQATHR